MLHCIKTVYKRMSCCVNILRILSLVATLLLPIYLLGCGLLWPSPTDEQNRRFESKTTAAAVSALPGRDSSRANASVKLLDFYSGTDIHVTLGRPDKDSFHSIDDLLKALTSVVIACRNSAKEKDQYIYTYTLERKGDLHITLDASYPGVERRSDKVLEKYEPLPMGTNPFELRWLEHYSYYSTPMQNRVSLSLNLKYSELSNIFNSEITIDTLRPKVKIRCYISGDDVRFLPCDELDKVLKQKND